MKKVKLYHLSLKIDEVIEDFLPRIPYAVMIGENETIPRVCASLSIEGALSAVPWGGSVLDTVFEFHEENVIEGEDYPEMQIRVYELIVPISDVVFSKELFQNGYVEDATETGECWITKSVKPSDVYDIFLSEWSEESFDRISYKDTLKLVEDVNYEDVWSGEVGIKIVSAIFTKNTVDLIKVAV